MSYGTNFDSGEEQDLATLLADEDSRLDEFNGESVSAASGVAVSGMWADSGEWVPMASSAWLNGTYTTTSTSYASVTGGSDAVVLPLSSIDSLTGIDAVGVSIGGVLTNDSDGEDNFARVSIEFSPIIGSEMTTTGDLPVAKTGPIAVVDNPGNARRFDLELKTTGGTVKAADSFTIVAWGKVA